MDIKKGRFALNTCFCMSTYKGILFLFCLCLSDASPPDEFVDETTLKKPEVRVPQADSMGTQELVVVGLGVVTTLMVIDLLGNIIIAS